MSLARLGCHTQYSLLDGQSDIKKSAYMSIHLSIMTTAQIIYEQYKVLPKRVWEELKALIISEEETEKPLSLMEEIEESLKQVKLIREGKLPRRTFADLEREMNDAE